MDIWSEGSRLPSMSRRVSLMLAYICLIFVQIASSAGWLGATNKEVSDRFPVPLTPEGWAFSIWGVIFGLQGLAVFYQVLDAGYDPDGEKQRFVNAIFAPWISSWGAASAWQFAFVLQTPGGMIFASLCLCAALAGMAVGLHNLYRLRKEHGPATHLSLYLMYFASTSINAAWLSVATAVQFLIAALSQTRDLTAGATFLAAVVAGMGAWVTIHYKDTAFGLTLIWAFVAVFEKTQDEIVRHASLAGIVLLLLACGVSVLKKKEMNNIDDDFESRQPLRSVTEEP